MTKFQHHFPTRVLIIEDQIAIALEIEAGVDGEVRCSVTR